VAADQCAYASGSHTATYTLTVTSASSGCYPAWSSTTSYVPNDQVSYGGHNYTSLYWSTGVQPGSAIAWNMGEVNGHGGESSPRSTMLMSTSGS